MRTISENLQAMAEELHGLLEELLNNHSGIRPWYTPGDEPASRSGLPVGPPAYSEYNYVWEPLDREGRRIQSRLLEDYRRFHSILRVLLREQPKDTLEVLRKAHDRITEIIEQGRRIEFEKPNQALEEAQSAINEQIALLERLFDARDSEPAFVPDTNALLYNPELETWRFDDAPRFTVILTPTVLSELDALKVYHRNERVRKTAQKLIRKIKEYRRRGQMTEGVTLVKGISTLLAIAVEPAMESSLPWLDSHSADDRILASLVQVMRLRPRSRVVLITRDINLQNKAEFARIPFIEPPELN